MSEKVRQRLDLVRPIKKHMLFFVFQNCFKIFNLTHLEMVIAELLKPLVVPLTFPSVALAAVSQEGLLQTDSLKF